MSAASAVGPGDPAKAGIADAGDAIFGLYHHHNRTGARQRLDSIANRVSVGCLGMYGYVNCSNLHRFFLPTMINCN